MIGAFQTGVITSGSPWWLSGGVVPANCVCAYQPKGAASISASLVNINNPGKNDAYVGTSPSSSEPSLVSGGWQFATNKYIDTGKIPGSTYSMVVKYSSGSGTTIGACGCRTSFRYYLRPITASGAVYGYGNAIYTHSTSDISGVMCLSKEKAYFNGTYVGIAGTTWVDANLSIIIGGERTGSAIVVNTGSIIIEAFALYSVELSSGQVELITAAMNSL